MAITRPLTAEARNTRARLAAATQRVARTAKAAEAAAAAVASARVSGDPRLPELIAKAERAEQTRAEAEAQISKLRAEWEGERWLSALADAVGAQRPALTPDQETRLRELLVRAGLR